jgi:polyisoprenoid-binding protein YceI
MKTLILSTFLFTTISTLFSQNITIKTEEAIADFYYVSEDTRGTFKNVNADININLSDLSTSKVSGKVDVTSISTGNIARDKMLKTKTYFNASAFPELTFKSSEIKKEGEQLVLLGTLNIKGFSKPTKFNIKIEENLLTLSADIFADDFGVAVNKGRETSLVNIEMKFPILMNK